MKNLIEIALNTAYNTALKNVPQTKTEIIYVNIENVSPHDLPEFLIENNIPKKCWFGGEPNGYDTLDEICVCYDVQIELTEQEKLIFLNKIFTQIAFKEVYNTLTKNNYIRTGMDSKNLQKFKKSVYQMYIEKYYSLFFK